MTTLTDTTIASTATDNNNVKPMSEIIPTSSVQSPTTQRTPVPQGPKHKLITEADVQVCRLNHTRTIVSKIMNSRYLRRWESHKIVLDDNEMRSATPIGFMELAVPYSSIEDVHIVSRWDAGHKFCLRITIQDGSVLLQAKNAYIRDQWLHSIQWKRHIFRSERLLKNARRPEILVKEIKSLIDVSLVTPIQDASVYRFPLDLVSDLLQENDEFLSKEFQETIIIALTPLLEKNHPTQEICDFFSKHCKDSPRSTLVIELFTPVVHRILKHNTDFGKYPRMRYFVQEYIQALNCQNDGLKVVTSLVKSMHGPGSTCPHPRVLPNLVAVCLAAIYNCYEERKHSSMENVNSDDFDQVEWENKLLCYVSMMETMSEFDDWRYILGSLLQPIPFPDDAIADSLFTSRMKVTIHNVSSDETCGVHQTLLGIREGKEGWFHLYCPGGIACDDDGQLWGVM
ncbi:C-Maf-inducing protein, partial [Elysia marginata]